MTSPVVTRFAPSPTGYLHIGGARTALFSWLYARGRGGRFLLRIEDTDRARHNKEAVKAIIDGLTWLGLDWDGEPISQYERRFRHAEIAHTLLDNGHAYKCYMTKEESEAAAKQAMADKRRFTSPWRDRPASDAPAGSPFVVRFKSRLDERVVVHDAVKGDAQFAEGVLEDLVLLRSDATPTYNLAVVVDDHDMGVTHVIRGDDHLVNAAKQQHIYEAMGWRVPVFAHVPLIHGQDGAKLSKRHGALGVEAYRDDGFLPEGLCNYLLRLGWSHGDEEIISRTRALEIFDIAGINKSPARLDLDKLRHTNAHYVRALSDADFTRLAAPFFDAAGKPLSGVEAERVRRSASFLKSRSATLKDAPDAAAFLRLARPISLTGKAAKPLEAPEAKAHLARLASTLEAVQDWNDSNALEQTLKGYAESTGIGFGAIGPALRSVLAGGLPSPALGEVLYSLGREESLARITDHLS